MYIIRNINRVWTTMEEFATKFHTTWPTIISTPQPEQTLYLYARISDGTKCAQVYVHNFPLDFDGKFTMQDSPSKISASWFPMHSHVKIRWMQPLEIYCTYNVVKTLPQRLPVTMPVATKVLDILQKDTITLTLLICQEDMTVLETLPPFTIVSEKQARKTIHEDPIVPQYATLLYNRSRVPPSSSPSVMKGYMIDTHSRGTRPRMEVPPPQPPRLHTDDDTETHQQFMLSAAVYNRLVKPDVKPPKPDIKARTPKLQHKSIDKPTTSGHYEPVLTIKTDKPKPTNKHSDESDLEDPL